MVPKSRVHFFPDVFPFFFAVFPETVFFAASNHDEFAGPRSGHEVTSMASYLISGMVKNHCFCQRYSHNYFPKLMLVKEQTFLQGRAFSQFSPPFLGPNNCTQFFLNLLFLIIHPNLHLLSPCPIFGGVCLGPPTDQDWLGSNIFDSFADVNCSRL